MDFKTVPIKLSDEIKEVMENRGIREEDIREVLEYAETTGKKLYIEGEEHYLAKKRLMRREPHLRLQDRGRRSGWCARADMRSHAAVAGGHI